MSNSDYSENADKMTDTERSNRPKYANWITDGSGKPRTISES